MSDANKWSPKLHLLKSGCSFICHTLKLKIGCKTSSFSSFFYTLIEYFGDTLWIVTLAIEAFSCFSIKVFLSDWFRQWLAHFLMTIYHLKQDSLTVSKQGIKLCGIEIEIQIFSYKKKQWKNVVHHRWPSYSMPLGGNTLLPRQTGSHFTDIFEFIFFFENCCIFIQISLKFVSKSQIRNQPALVQIMAGCQKVTSHYLNQYWPSLLMHICVTQPCWVNTLKPDKMVDILHKIILFEFSWIKMCKFWKKNEMSFLRVQLTLSLHWFS